MKIKLNMIVVTVLFSTLIASCKNTEKPVPNVREPFHAGAFYPAASAELNGVVDQMLSAAKDDYADVPKAVIVPHAGYVYSGATAAYAYKLFQKAPDEIKRVILLAPSHYSGFIGIDVNDRDYKTPIGTYRVDIEAIEKLKSEKIPYKDDVVASTREHSDEVQVPFLLKVLPNARLVPIIVGELNASMIEDVARALSKIIDDRTVIVVSSDFTHYGPRFDYTPKFKTGDIKKGIAGLDNGAIEKILKTDTKGFLKYTQDIQATICGRTPIAILLKVFELNNWAPETKLLKYTTSGELTGDWENSVSYAAIALGKLRTWTKAAEGETKYLNKDEEKTLLKLSRTVLTDLIKNGQNEFSGSKLKDFKLTDAVKKEHGVFVTLKEHGDLRGCIGSIIGAAPLYQGVIENTMNAAVRDPRFPPVQASELKEINIEISVMSPLEKVKSLNDIKVGRDGLILKNGYYSGVFLPQVPVEQHWDKKTYLEELGHKAGLDKNAYKDKATTLYKFSAQVFGEE